MKVKRIIPYFVIAILLVAYVAFLAVCSLSSGIIGTKRIGFSSGSFAYDAEDISVVLQDGETDLLDQFENLKSVDLSGSKNYAEILDWASRHPGVSVFYTVELPNGTAVGCDSAEADFSGIPDAAIPEAVGLLEYLPNVQKILLGDVSISSASAKTILSAKPGIQLEYTVPILGKSLSKDEPSVDLTGLKSADVDTVLDRMTFLTSLGMITIGNDATQNGDITWQDITRIAGAFPNAVLNYNFTVCGQKASLSDETLDLSGAASQDVDKIIEVLPGMTQLKTLKLGNLTSEDVLRISEATDASIDYSLTIYGKTVNLSDEIWDFNHIEVGDGGKAVSEWLPCAKHLKVLDMDTCGVGNKEMAAIRDANPSVEVIWRVNFGSSYSVRTNVTKILASKPSKGGTLYNGDVNEALQYCTKVRYLDLGHNDNLSDFSFVKNMPDLEIIVISMCNVSDLTPFASCPNLLYMEAGNTRISDLSPLANCKKLKHLNVGTCSGVRDISCLYELDLLRLWLGVGDPVPSEQVAKMKELHPDCEINTTASTGLERDDQGNIISEGYTAENWKFYQKYLTSDWSFYSYNHTFPAQRPLGYFKVVYKSFQYNLADSAYSFYWNDPKYNPHDESVKPVNTYIMDTSFLSEVWDWKKDDEKIVEDVLSDPPGEIISEGLY